MEVSEICGKMDIQVYLKGGNTIKNLLVAPKDKATSTQKGGVIYKYKCNRVECDEFVGSLQGPLGKDLRNTLGPLPQFLTMPTSQAIKPVRTQVWVENHITLHGPYKATCIRVNDTSLNTNIGTYQLSHIWDEVMFSTP